MPVSWSVQGSRLGGGFASKLILQIKNLKEELMKKLIYFIIIFLLVGMYSVTFGQDSSYIIGPGDKLEISVWKDASLSRVVIVPPDRMLSFPLIGDIDITNLTVAKLREALTKKLSEYVPDATVTVMILEFNYLRAFVIGKVNKPGEFQITMDTNVMQILSMAEGLNPYASEGKIHILRQAEGQSIKIPFNYKEVIKGKNLEQNILLKSGDVVLVP